MLNKENPYSNMLNIICEYPYLNMLNMEILVKEKACKNH